MVNDGKKFAGQVDERLDGVLDPTIPVTRQKYDDKNALIDECDAIFDQNEEKFLKMEEKLADHLKKLDDIFKALDTVSPVNNPSPGSRDNADFLKDVSGGFDKANASRDKLEGLKKRLEAAKDKHNEDIQPLNELGDREVKQPEI